jgi:EAL domain-containing protein (putative c-di-GMP-specific phosphodiesterase class I)
MIELEITESMVMRDPDRAAEVMEALHEMGVRIAIDDFGSDFANQGDLQKMPLDLLKVDRSTLGASDDEEYRSWLFQTILVLGRDLALPVVAKEVETFEQLVTLQALGCAMAQGYLIGKPAPLEQVETVINTPLPSAAAEQSSAAHDAPQAPGSEAGAGPAPPSPGLQ